MAQTMGLTHPAAFVMNVTVSDTVNLPQGVCRALYVGVTGNVVIVDGHDFVRTFYNAQAGSVLPVQVKRVNSTNTTATQLLALY